MSEADLRREFIKLTKPLDPRAIENIVGIGDPDICFVPGVCELKWARAWPVRNTTPLRLDHYTDVQRDRLLTRWNAGGGSWLVLTVRSIWLCYTGVAAQRVGFLTKQELIDTATNYSATKPDSVTLCSWFKR